jgi:two-component system, chemotaxis family, sensor kinase CheA
MDNVAQFKATFFQECAERLSDLEGELSQLASLETRTEALNGAFRSVHSIKGGAGMFGFARLVAFAHKFESVLDLMREGKIAVTNETVDAALRAGDVIADLVAAARTGNEPSAEHEATAVERLAAAAGVASFEPTATPAVASPTKQRSGGTQRFRIEFKPHSHMLRRLSEPLLIVAHLREMGTLEIVADLQGLPDFAELEPTDSYLAWVFELVTPVSVEEIAATFEFVEGDCDLSIAPVVDSPIREPNAARSEQTAGSGPEAIAPSSQNTRASESAKSGTSVRVDLDRIDRLFDLVGEITVARALVAQHCNHDFVMSNPVLSQGLTQLLQLTSSLHDNIMAIRAQPVRTIFSRMPRLVRDLSEKTGKDARLEMTGEDTEIDKTIIEELSDPLVHIIRNAVDHGLEPAEQRIKNGKSPRGTIRIDAMQRGSRIVIQVSDDGRGIDRDKVRRTAISKNLIASDAQLTDEEIDNLVFLPGLSTSQSVSDISGRGVGMDVVLRNLQRVGGRVSLRSEPGRGTTTTLTFPLTLAVMDGMTVRVGDERYVLPLSSIVECLSVPAAHIKTIPGTGEVINVRGRHIRIARLSGENRALGTIDGSQMIILVEADGGSAVGVVVDEIVGQQQVVIKSIRENIGHIEGIAGATILGDGAVALILDVGVVTELGRSIRFDRPRAGLTQSGGRLVA